MKISIFLDRYLPIHETKDPGQITAGLMENQVETNLITLAKNELINYSPSFEVVQIDEKTINTVEYWKSIDSDIVLVYTWLGGPYTPLVQKIKKSGKKVIVKCDSTGRIAFPLKIDYMRIPLRERFTLRDILRNIWWYHPLKLLNRKFATPIIAQIEACDKVIIESQEALTNISFFLLTWSRPDLIEKIYCVPNPVTPDFIDTPLKNKENIIISYGRWDDYRIKNTKTMITSTIDFLKLKPDYKSIIFGSGEELVKLLVNEYADAEIKCRIEIIGKIEHPRIPNLIANAKIMFQPSRWESACIAAAESICMGCSIVGTPLESLRYLSMQGFSGTTSATLDKKAILGALLEDSKKWDNNLYQPEIISKYWRKKLNRKSIAKEIQEIATKK